MHKVDKQIVNSNERSNKAKNVLEIGKLERQNRNWCTTKSERRRVNEHTKEVKCIGHKIYAFLDGD